MHKAEPPKTAGLERQERRQKPPTGTFKPDSSTLWQIPGRKWNSKWEYTEPFWTHKGLITKEEMGRVGRKIWLILQGHPYQNQKALVKRGDTEWHHTGRRMSMQGAKRSIQWHRKEGTTMTGNNILGRNEQNWPRKPGAQSQPRCETDSGLPSVTGASGARAAVPLPPAWGHAVNWAWQYEAFPSQA